jgi:hypothetical protein
VSQLLDTPASSDELYIARGDPVEPWRPLMQGDVFRDVAIAGLRDVPGSEHVMIVAHPCSMRAGAQLVPHIQVVPVVAHPSVPFEKWADGFVRVMPLPDLIDDGGYAARLTLFGMVDAAELTLERRVACLSARGVLLLQQRFVYSLTRTVVKLATLERAVSGALEEAELLEEWQERAAAVRVEQGDPLPQVLAEESERFEQLLRAAPEHGQSLRAQLDDGPSRVGARRAIYRAIDRRVQELTAGSE